MAYFSDYCIAVSRGVAREIVEFYDVSPDRVQVISNWYDPSVFRQFDVQIARCLLNLKTAARYLFYVGHFNMSRGKIMAEILRRLPNDITLLVAHHEEDKAIIAEFGDRVRFMGHSTPQTLALYYSAADLLCFPSLYGGFGLVLIEAMACGCPPVVFDYAAMNELVTDDSGYLVTEPTADAYSPSLSGHYRMAAKRRRQLVAALKHFTWIGKSSQCLISTTSSYGSSHARPRRHHNQIGAGGRLYPRGKC